MYFLRVLVCFLWSVSLPAQFYMSASQVLAQEGYSYTKVELTTGHLLLYVNELHYGKNRTYLSMYRMEERQGDVGCVARIVMVHTEYFDDYLHHYSTQYVPLSDLLFHDPERGLIIELGLPSEAGYFQIMIYRDDASPDAG